ncbi:MAG: NAD(P)-dependent oxidoreductase [Rhodospirillales bacterium]|nr:NAD(P)-dependent oxidoreductase [Rhodospirillales bacterium]
MSHQFDTLLITGAAGRLGSQLRRGLAPLARRLRLSDRTDIADLRANEEAVVCDLADAEAVRRMTQGVDAIVHFGGAALETDWETILSANIRGGYNIYEGARQNGVKRVVYASSVHAIGYHGVEAHIDASASHRPDSLYGVSKCFVEDLSRLYWDKFGIETACCRIFSSFDQYSDRRMLWSMLTFDDCVRLVEACLTAPRVAHSIIFGTSRNRHQMVDNCLAGHIGFQPQDSTEADRAAVEARLPAADPDAPAVRYLGGWFVNLGHPDDRVEPPATGAATVRRSA